MPPIDLGETAFPPIEKVQPSAPKLTLPEKPPAPQIRTFFQDLGQSDDQPLTDSRLVGVIAPTPYYDPRDFTAPVSVPVIEDLWY
ncbi:MAG: hypothetical protein ACK4UN_08875, partial [Limisphaerales bacterium]